MGERAKRLGVMIETAKRLQRVFQRVLSVMAERRVTDIMRQALRLRQILVQPQRTRYRATDLRNFKTMG